MQPREELMMSELVDTTAL